MVVMARAHGKLRQPILTAIAVSAVTIALVGYIILFSKGNINDKITETLTIKEDASPYPPCISYNRMSSPPPPPSGYDLAYKQSFGFFDDIDEGHWKRLQQRVRKRVNYKILDDYDWKQLQYKGVIPTSKDPNNPMLMAEKGPLWYQAHLEPDFTCLDEQRIGGLGDGPKWVCDPHRLARISNERKQQGIQPGCLVYSIGSAGRFQFEDGLYDFLGSGICEFHIFDPQDYTRPGDEARGMYFHAWGIQGSTAPRNPNFKTIPETIRELGHEDRTIDLFKIDCEGCEWNSYKDWLQYDIRQIQVETHLVPSNAMEFFDGLQAAGFLMYSKEFNVIVGGQCVEWGFIRVHPDFFAES